MQLHPTARIVAMTVSLNLISHKLCPYVQRAVVALNEKGVPFERIDIDLANKPDWFLKLSPLGKVPVLAVRTEKGRGRAVREQRDLRVHRGDARRPKTASD
jgi:glutathione S-transferase